MAALKDDAVLLLVAGGALLFGGAALGRTLGQQDVRRAQRAERYAEVSADSLVRFIAHRKCWFDPTPRDFWKGATHR